MPSTISALTTVEIMGKVKKINKDDKTYATKKSAVLEEFNRDTDSVLEDDNVYANAYANIKRENIKNLNEHITELDKILSPEQLDLAIERYGKDIAKNEKCPEKIKKLILEKDPQNLSVMKNPSTSLQEFAFKKDYTVIPYLTIDITEDMAIKSFIHKTYSS